MKITIIGAGNIGIAMATVISAEKNNELMVYTSKAKKWDQYIFSENMLTGTVLKSEAIKFSDDFDLCIRDADIIFIAIPSFARKNIIDRLEDSLNSTPVIIFVPGCGGIEYCCENLINMGCVVAGTDRVPCVSRIVEYGNKVAYDWKKSVRLAAIDRKKTVDICNIVADILKLKCLPLKNYLTVTLTPSNQIMHTVRLYSMFKNNKFDDEFDHNILFYGEWDNETSEYLLKCDNELNNLCSSINREELSEVIPLRIHYEADNAIKMTNKIHSIESFKRIESPMLKCDNGKFKIDFSSRYFKEDFPFGLCIIKSLGVICGVDMPDIDNIIRWYETISGADYFGDGSWNGEDLENLNLPENYGIKSKKDVIEFYS